jgi:hypothetical protein
MVGFFFTQSVEIGLAKKKDVEIGISDAHAVLICRVLFDVAKDIFECKSSRITSRTLSKRDLNGQNRQP